MTCIAKPWRSWPVCLAAVLLLSWGLTPAALAKRPSAPKLLPRSTVAFVSIVDAPEMAQRFMNTDLGRMTQDPQLKPLLGHLYGTITAAASQLKEQIGLSLPELLAIPQGELTVAMVAPEEGDPAVVFLLDVGDQLSNARKLVKRGTEALDKSGAAKTEETIAGTKVVTYKGGRTGGPPNMVFFEKEATIVAGSDPAVVKQLLSVWNGGEGDTLAENPSFGAVMQRCRGADNEPPHFVWYADPIGIVRSVGSGNPQVRFGLAVLPALGLDGLSAVGGSMIFDTGQFDSVMHGHLLLESPRSGIVKMIALESGDFEPEPWVPDDVASYMTLHWNIQQTYETLAGLFDSFREEGSFSRELSNRILGPTGIDLEKDIIPSLEGRISLMVSYQRPISVQSQAMMLGLKLKETAPIEDALKKVVKISQGNLVEKTYGGKKYYQLDPPGMENMPPEQRPPMPCFGVVGESLLMSNNSALLEKAIATRADGSNLLADALDFKLVASKIRRQAGDVKPAMISFDRPEEAIRFLYELVNSEQVRTGLAQAAENSAFMKSLQTALEENPLPPFSVLQQYLAPGGAMVTDDASGLHYMAFSLRRESE